MMRCTDCGIFFEEENAEMIDDGFFYEYFGECGVYHDDIPSCPNCGSVDVEPAEACKVCGKAIRSGETYCEQCADEVNDMVSLLAKNLGIDYESAWDLIDYAAETRQ